MTGFSLIFLSISNDTNCFDILDFLDDDSQTDSSPTTRPGDAKSTASPDTTPGELVLQITLLGLMR